MSDPNAYTLRQLRADVRMLKGIVRDRARENGRKPEFGEWCIRPSHCGCTLIVPYAFADGHRDEWSNYASLVM